MPDTTAVYTIEGQHQYAVKCFQEGHYKEAARILGEVLKIKETSEIWNDWATVQLMCNQTAASERGYSRALSMDPANTLATGNLGVLLARTGRIPEAIPLLEQAAAKTSGREREALLRLVHTCRGERSSCCGAKNKVPAKDEDDRTQQDDTELPASHPYDGGQSANIPDFSKSVAAAPACGADQAFASAGDPSVQQGAAAPAPLPPRARSTKAGVYFQGLIYGSSGYAEEAWVVALGMSDYQIPVQLVPLGQARDTENLLTEEARQRLATLQQQTVDLSRSVFLQFAVAQAWDMGMFGRWCVGRTMFESDRLPDGISERCNAMDEIWVPSRFNLESYARAGVREGKLRLVSPGVNTQLFRPGAVPLQIPGKRGFNFLSVFDWQQRKGYDVLLHAYLAEFKPDEDVALILKVSHVNDALADLPTQIAYIVEREAGLPLEKAPPIILIDGFIPQKEMPRLYATGDCFVLPTRGEGYGRPFLEALSCRLPVIATGWSGQTDLLSHENSYVIDYRLAPVPDDVDLEIFAGHQWAEPDVNHLRQLMRHVFSHKDEAATRAERGRADMVQQYDWSVIIPRWVAELRRLLG